ncbi:hypothetical protein [Pseudomonas anguilliseptica]|uniref:hypothetical protein n=1 Tax=Pseudomonas anguilliseptica TaxID=53406 RepID=UPI0022AED16D|nr:hypothetical protein [Pseudomonas anguilliseptica]MCZ4321457.1 hypothetical protein [Pseudomonas anguilliseptica]
MTVQSVQLALYKGKGQIGNAAIRLWTGSPYSHCELVVDGWCYSSSVMDKGVRRKRVGPGADEISLSEDHWDLIELPWADGAAIVRYFEATDSDTYGWPSLIASQVFNRNQPSEHAAFCSEWCMRALFLPNPSIFNPGTAGEQCRWLTESWRARLTA